MLIDLDLAKDLGSGRSGARCRTGTMEFMANEVLLGISHTYRHDIESLFYVLIWQCARRGWAFLNKQPDQYTSKLRAWYTGNYEDIANAKRGNMDANGFGFILREFRRNSSVSRHFAGSCGKYCLLYVKMLFSRERRKIQRFSMDQSSKHLTRLLMISRLQNKMT